MAEVTPKTDFTFFKRIYPVTSDVIIYKRFQEFIGFGICFFRRPKLELEDFREVDFRYPAKLVWCGTSLSNRYLDEQEVSRETRFQVKKVQAFTVSPENAKRRPELNVSFVLPQKITKDETILVVETGVNERDEHLR